MKGHEMSWLEKINVFKQFILDRIFKPYWKVLKQYLANCNIHGVKYLVGAEYTIAEKIFWLIACIVSYWGCSVMIISVLEQYVTDPVAVTAETSYLNWKTPFPSLALCYQPKLKGREYATELVERDKQQENFWSKIFFIHSFGFTSAPSLITAEELLKIYETMIIPCPDIFASCSWNGKPFDCCKEFKSYKTGLGYCLGINSYHTKNPDESDLKFYVNRTIKYGTMIIDLVKNEARQRVLSMFIMNNLNLPLLTSSEERSLTSKTGINAEFTLRNIYNEKGVKGVPMKRRNCRFPFEVTENSLFPIYSSDSCALEVYINRMINLCGCVSFFYPAYPNARICNMTETECLFHKKETIISTNNLKKICYPDCEGTDIKLIRLRLMSHPTVRYYRYVVMTELDLVVAVGSAMGLFMGASILSLCEIPYWLFIRRDRIS
ncbi:sodium channel protein Nach isoform X2 [Prorops nasuta]|uniref:sodium channel protein Nach isoform X2 n=1 Tax=Prorops nasuta TaxID=863751 RepID=UPI0034CE88DC